MKRFVIFMSVLCLAAMTMFAQAPKSFKYQAVIRNTDGSPYSNQTVTMRISIVSESPENVTADYAEVHLVETSDMGLVNLNIGEGEVTTAGTLADVNWGAGAWFIRVEFDPNAGANFTLFGASQLLSVPYALYADKAGSVNYENLTGAPDLSQFVTADDIPQPFSGDYQELTNTPDLSKFITQLRVSLTGDKLYFNDDNYVIIPGISKANDTRGLSNLTLTEISGEHKFVEIYNSSSVDISLE